ncbi:serine hydrolase [Flectobacillus sp. BAB-3569]|nr:serine hydrolase [Flectobacillus sp. BAB-3569]
MPLKRNLFLLLLAVFYPFCRTTAQLTPQKIAQVDSAMRVLHAQGQFSGVVLLSEKGKIKFQKALGYTDYLQRTALDAAQPFNLASITKQFVATMTMKLFEQGKLEYDQKVIHFIPNFPYQEITIRQLLTHTSGLPEYFDMAMSHLNTLDTLTNDKLIQLLVEKHPPLNFASGTKWEYCNTGYLLLASIIEKASGTSFEHFFSTQISQPFGLKNTFVYFLNGPNQNKKRVLGFERKNGKAISNDLILLDGVVGDGNIYSSAEDLNKWIQLVTENKVLKPATWAEAFTPVQLKDGSSYPYGFGWGISENGFEHTGSWVGFQNAIFRNNKTQTTAILLSNGTNPIFRNILKKILAGQPFHLPKTHLIKNIKLIDGTGLPSQQVQVRIKDNKIWEIGKLEPFVGETVTDGNGLILAPGFIDSHSHHYGSLDKTPTAIPMLSQGITTIVIGQDGSSYAMDSLSKWMKEKPVAVNVASYTGHATLRQKVMGPRGLYRTARPEEVEKMKVLLETELQKGSIGLNTGLEYESSFFSNRDEVLELAKVAAINGGRYMSHIRSEDINLTEAIDEIIDIGREAKIPVQISHGKIALRSQWKSAHEVLAKLQEARAEGIQITADCYPYTFWHSTLRVLFPKRDYTNLESAQMATEQLFDPKESIIVRFAPNKSYAGKTLAEIAGLRGKTEAQTLMDLVAEAEAFDKKYPDYDEGIEAIMGKSMDDEDVEAILAWPHTNICSDGAGSGHPRGHGAFTRVLGKYVREKKLFSWETAIYKMTGLTAENLGIQHRGLIKPDCYADMVLFDPETVVDHADVKNPKALSSGIKMVWVNGELVWQDQKPTGKLSGQMIKR